MLDYIREVKQLVVKKSDILLEGERVGAASLEGGLLVDEHGEGGLEDGLDLLDVEG